MVLAIAVALSCIKIYGYFIPFTAGADNSVAELAQWTIFCNLFSALLLRVQVTQDSDRATFGLILIAINCIVWTVGIANIIAPNVLRARDAMAILRKKKKPHVMVKSLDTEDNVPTKEEATAVSDSATEPRPAEPQEDRPSTTELVRMGSKEQIAPETMG